MRYSLIVLLSVLGPRWAGTHITLNESRLAHCLRRCFSRRGAAMAGAMFAIQEIYEGPKQDEMVAVSESPDEPGDIDENGIMMTIGDDDVESNPPRPS